MLAGGPAPPVQVRHLGPNGIQLADGLEIASPCIFLEGKVFLWNVPETLWQGWTKDHLQIFDVVVPKPGWVIYYSTRNIPSEMEARNPIIWNGENRCTTPSRASQSP